MGSTMMTIRNMGDIKWLSLLFLLAFILLPIRSFADEKDEADTLENHGMALYQQELYDEAVRAFRQLLKLRPNQQVYFNIGQCEFMRQRFDLALEAFTVYLSGDREKIAKKRLEYTEKVVEKITPLVGTLDIRGESPLEVWIDDELRCSIPLSSPLHVLEGEHRLAFKKDGEIVQTETYAVKPGETITIQAPEVALEPTPTPAPVVEPVPKEPPNEIDEDTSESTPEEPVVKLPPKSAKSPLTTIGLLTASLGGAALVAGIVTGSKALSKDSQLAEKCPNIEKICSESNRDLANSTIALGTAATVLIPIGGVAVVTGVTLAIIGQKKNAEQRESREIGIWRVEPYSSRSGAGIMIKGRF
jgi:Ca2+/Na+ antiporter